jgi:hypothetical protein
MGHAKFNEAFRPGQIFDTGVGEVFKEGIRFLPVFFQNLWLEWAPRDSGKGLQNVFETDDIMEQTEQDATGRDALPNGNYIVETKQFIGLNLEAQLRPTFISFASTQIKKGKHMLTLATSEEIARPDGSFFQAPLWYRAYKLGSVPESNAKGNWIGWTIERGLSIPEYEEKNPAAAKRLFEKAMSLRELVEQGKAKVDTSTLEEEQTGGGGRSKRGEADTGQEM